MTPIFNGQGVDHDLARKLAEEQAERDNTPTATLQTADTPEELENAPKVPVENIEMTQEEAMAQLPEELKAAMGKIMKYHGKWAVRLPDVMRKVDGKEVRSERFLSNNGEAMRVFHTKQQAQDGLAYYQALVMARIELREAAEKKAEEEKQENCPHRAALEDPLHCVICGCTLLEPSEPIPALG